MFTHQCIKTGCPNTYQDNDPDSYYCEECNVLRKRLAQEMDGKFNTTGQEPNGMLVQYDRARQGRKFPKANAIGL